MAYIYILTNIQNGKAYIGQTSRSVDVRLSEHLSESKINRKNNIIYKAIRKYGIENFHIECLEVSDKLANLWEAHLIERWKSITPNGYNIIPGGNKPPSWLGKKHSIEARKKMSDNGKKRGGFFKGHHHTDEWKIKASIRKSGINSAMYGKKHSEETKKRMSEARIGMKFSEEHKRNLSKNHWYKKEIILIHPDGIEEYFESITKACKKYNISNGNLIRRNLSKGYKFREVIK